MNYTSLDKFDRWILLAAAAGSAELSPVGYRLVTPQGASAAGEAAGRRLRRG
jgi:hypothetical protein